MLERFVIGVVALGLLAIVALVLSRVSRRLEDSPSPAGRRVRWWTGRVEGLRYRASGRRPADDVSDRVVAERARASLGPVRKRIHAPSVHVTVQDHIARLHGVVDDGDEAAKLDFTVSTVPGVHGVESYLHAVGDPSSDERRSLYEAAQQPGGLRHEDAEIVFALVVAGFSEHLPEGLRADAFAHLPPDVQVLLELPRRHGEAVCSLEPLPDQVRAVVSHSDVDDATAERTVRSVAECLAVLSGREAHLLGGALPPEVRDLWPASP